ncbi:MAG: SDR family NAD(P)-dependent oxidoreductase [Chloroflexota bacterium]|nr:SDR family NAD(P)-dependent oxidoreductase [Chloroflexota bacterium]
MAVEAAGLNFSDVLISVGAVDLDPQLGDEFCGRITEVGPGVTEFNVGDRVLGLGIGTFRPEVVTRAAMVAPAPDGMPAAALATFPTSFVSAEIAFQMSGLHAGDRVLIHTASGGVGLAAIQLVRAAGAEVFATASGPKQAYLRSLGIEHVFDSRTTDFGEQVLQATGGEGVTVVLNSLTGPGFIEASVDCLAGAGRFVEMGRRDIWTAEQMADVRPDVSYSVLEVDQLKRREPETAGASLRRVMARVETGELKPLVYTRWPMAEISDAMEFMRSARHIGKNVIVMPPLTDGRLRADRSYLVTGGLGGIGIVVAGWLADRGAGVIVLNGRRPPDSEAKEAIESLRRQGADVRVELADVTDPAAVDAMLARIDAEMPPLAGVIHSVGVLSDGSLGNQTWERYEMVLWPKVLGAWRLHEATLDRDLDMFVLFSSITGIVGNSGQGNHAAANAFLDQLAGYRRALGLPGQAIAWGAWAGLGEAEEQRERIERQLAASGTRWISPQQGLRAFDELVRQDTSAAMVAAVDWPVLAENFEERPLFLDELLVDESAGGDGGAVDADLLSQLRERSPAEWEETLVSFLQRELQAVLRSPATPAPNIGFFDLGMDSLMSVELRNRMNRALSGQYTVSNTAVFDYPNVAALAAHLAGELGEALGGDGAPSVAAAPRVRREVPADEDAVAIVGMACRFPGAPDLESFWELLATGTDAVTDGRQDAGPWTGLMGDPEAENPLYRRGGFVEGIDKFDNSFFRISPIEARMMDPQQRMLLETTWQALEDAGMDPEGLRGSRTGVYVGVGGSEYREVITASGQDEMYFGTTGSVTAGRVAFVLGLEGPAIAVDTACASSLVAVHQAAAALQRGEVDMALAGGTNSTLSLPVVRFHRDIGMISASGQCSAFDASADGFVRSEGCGVLVLKRLGQAEADGDRIWGLVLGSAVNQNGASAGLPVPNGPAQERVMEDALARAGVEPSDIDYMEAHGTGTALGDSIELNALASVYGRGRDADRPLLVGSVKTNIGHGEWVAGMASIMKAVLAMRSGLIPAHLHFREPNASLPSDQTSLRITSQQTAWPSAPGRRVLSAVNSFGLSGTNAHMVLEGHGPNGNGASANGGAQRPASALQPAGEPQRVDVTLRAPFADVQPPEDMAAAREARVLPISGKTPQALRAMAARYVEWLDEHALELAGDAGWELLADMAWTAGAGRSHFGYRAGLAFGDVPELRAKLQALAESENPDGEQPRTRNKVAFVYSGAADGWPSGAAALYGTEPVVRAVLDRCERVLQDERGLSLLEPLLGGDDAAIASDPALERAATFAVQAAMTALWQSVGLRPSAVLGHGIGELAAALAAEALSIDDGLRLAVALSGPEAALPQVAANCPSRTMVSSVTGRAVQPADALDNAHWRKLTGESAAHEACLEALASTGADLVVEIGDMAVEGAANALWPAGTAGETAAFVDGANGFPDAVARAYEAGATLSFDGLFAGELRRRVSIPSYSFQRRSLWVQSR